MYTAAKCLFTECLSLNARQKYKPEKNNILPAACSKKGHLMVILTFPDCTKLAVPGLLIIEEFFLSKNCRFITKTLPV